MNPGRLRACALRGFVAALCLFCLAGISTLSGFAADNGLAQHPYMGWSSWSFLRSHPDEQKIKAQADALISSGLRSLGYEYVNIDSGWTSGFDSAGCPTTDLERFPDGMKGLATYLHQRKLKLGIYLLPGLNKKVWEQNPQIEGTTYHVRDIADVNQPGNTINSAYHIDFQKPGAREYIQSCAKRFAEWEVDFIKMDFVGPGGGKNPSENQEDIRQWMTALKATGRPIWLELSNSLKIEYVQTWKAYSNGWRINGDIECYHCEGSPLTSWVKASKRFADVLPWAKYAGPGGWNDLDSLEIGNGDKDGLTTTERQTVMTLWAISCAPLFLGSDLTNLAPEDMTLLRNKEVIAVDQAGQIATPFSTASKQQVWRAQNKDGSYTVALFNLDDAKADISVSWSDFGLKGKIKVHDLWAQKDLGKVEGKFSATLDPHGSRLLRISK